MKISILFLMALIPFLVKASPLVEVIAQLEAVNNLKIGPAYGSCFSEDGQSFSDNLYTPQQAIEDIHSGDLKYVGRALIGGDQNLTCVFKSDRAYILYNNCMSSRKEASATDIEVISFSGGITRFYILANEGPVSSLPRSEYDVSWRVTSSLSEPPGNLSIGDFKEYMKKSNPINNGMCFVGRTFEAQDMDTEAYCSRLSDSTAKAWREKAEPFWRQPGEKWLKTKQKLWKAVKER